MILIGMLGSLNAAEAPETAAAASKRLIKDVKYLGDMRQQGYHVTLWRLRFKDGSDDALATLSMKGDKVGGYWIK